MKKIVRRILIGIVALGLIISSNTKEAKAIENKNVLFISSYSPAFISFHDQIRGISESLEDNVTLQIEYMDFRNFETEQNEKNFYGLLKYKLSKYKDIDAIIVGDDPALHFALKYRDDLFQDIPIIFLGINNLELAKKAVEENEVYGIGEAPSIEDNIELIEKIHKPKNIIMVTDESIMYSQELKALEALKDKYRNINFDTLLLNNLTYYEFIRELRNLGNDDILLVVYAFNDKTGTEIDSKVMVDIIQENTDIPIYSALDYYMGEKFVGGKVISHYEYGKKAGEITTKILNKQSVFNKYIEPDDANKEIYNYKVLRKNHINSKVLSNTATVVGRPIDAISRYSNILIPGIIVLLSLITIIIFLLINAFKRKQYEKELLKAKEEAEAYNRTKNHFITNISHELRTPVTVVMSSSDLIQLNLQKTEDTSISNNGRNLRIIKQNCFRQLRLINNLIDIAKTEAGYTNLNLRNVEIVSEIEEIVLSVVPYGEKKHLDIIFDTSDEEIFMAVDVEKLERIILNLLSNAIKFSKEYGNIFVNVLKRDNYTIISVEDNGIGIERENLTKVFDKFIQLDETMTRENEGSGIGLSIVDSFVKLHSGNISVESEVNKGSKFTIELPINMVANSEENSQRIEKGESTIATTNIELSDIYF